MQKSPLKIQIFTLFIHKAVSQYLMYVYNLQCCLQGKLLCYSDFKAIFSIKFKKVGKKENE